MPLDLNLKITADASEATRALADVESGIKKVEGAAKSTADPISKVTSNIKDLATTEATLAKEVANTTKHVEFGTEAYFKARRATVDQQIASDKLAIAQEGLMGQINAVTVATGLSTTALTGLGLAVTAVVGSGVAWMALLGSAAKHYFDTAEATKDSRDELDKLSESYETFQTIVGRSILGGSFSIVAPIHALNNALVATGVLLAARIEEYKFWIDLVMRGNLTLFGPNGQLPGIAQGTQSGAGLLMWQHQQPGTTGYAFQETAPGQTPAWQAQQLYEAQQRENTKAAREHRAPKKITVADLPSPGVYLGISGMPGGRYPIPSPLFDWNSLDPTVYGAPGSLPGATGYMPQGLPGGGPGFWGQGGGFQGAVGQAAYFGGYGPSAAAGAQIRAGLQQGGFGGYAAAGMGAMQAAQEVWANTSEGGAGRRALGGAMSGAAAGTMIMPGIGTAIGAGVGALVGAIRGWLAPTDYDKRVAQLETDRTSAHQMLQAPGLRGMWDTLGGNVPFDFNFLKTQAQNDPTRIKGYLDEMLVKTERLDEAMKKYGITWEELGDKAQQSHIDTMAKTLIEDFEVLTLAGADVTFVIEKMGSSVNDFVQAALRTGSEVPAAMKPMVEKMIEMGLLTDADGKKFDTLEETGITFAKTMTQGFDSISTAIEHLAIAMGYIPDKLNDITDAAHTAGDALDRVKTPGSPQDDPDYYGIPGRTNQPESPLAHTGGLIRGYGLPVLHRGGDVPILAQSGEFVMSRSAVNRIGVGTLSAMNLGGSGSMQVSIDLRGAVIADDFTRDRLAQSIGTSIVAHMGGHARLRVAKY